MSSLDSSQIDPIRVNSAATTNPVLVKAGKCAISTIVASNIGAAAAFLKFYDKATAPVPGTDVPVLTVSIPAGGFASLALGDIGPPFELGLGLGITNLAADNDATAVVAGQVKVLGGVIAS